MDNFWKLQISLYDAIVELSLSWVGREFQLGGGSLPLFQKCFVWGFK